MNGKQFFEVLARLPARVWVQAILGLIGFVVLAVLGFAVIAGVAAFVLLVVLVVKARTWFLGLFGRTPRTEPPTKHGGKVIDVQYEIVDKRERDGAPRP